MLLYYYKPLYKPRADYSIVPGLGKRAEKKRKKRKKTYEIIGTNSTAFARESKAEEVEKWRELKQQADIELREIRERISDLSRREAARKRVEVQLAKEAKKLQALEKIKANFANNIRRKRARDFMTLISLVADELLRDNAIASVAHRGAGIDTSLSSKPIKSSKLIKKLTIDDLIALTVGLV